ncbi:unnamed protein product [Lampetra fluviatilis]
MAPPTDFSGTWEMVSNDKWDDYMKALDIDFATRKVAGLLKIRKEVTQNGDSFTFKTMSSLRNYDLSFTAGVEFTEQTKGLDNRTVQTTVRWEGDRLVCEQKGEKTGRGWSHWIQDGQMHLWL